MVEQQSSAGKESWQQQLITKIKERTFPTWLKRRLKLRKQLKM